MRAWAFVVICAACYCAAGDCSRPVGQPAADAGPEAGLNPYPCISDVCSGCCTPDGWCVSGTSDTACGGDGECVDCTRLGGLCVEGQCADTESCSPSNCPGCCDSGGQCRAGTTLEHCGASGSSCASCEDGVCVDGTCQSGCHDADGDGYGPGCTLGEDCDDRTPGIQGPCDENGCPEGWTIVPDGPFWAGCDLSEDPHCTRGPGTTELGEENLSAFCIQRTEVPVVELRGCQDAGFCPSSLSSHVGPACNWREDRTEDWPYHPLNCVNFQEALHICRTWFGGTLPAELQWEKAARGTDGRYYPWGDEPAPSCASCNIGGCVTVLEGDPITWPVTDMPGAEGDSPYGIKNMCGNVAEMTTSCYDPVGQQYGPGVSCSLLTRGGSIYPDHLPSDFSLFLTYFRNGLMMNPDSSAPGLGLVGFRCVREPAISQ